MTIGKKIKMFRERLGLTQQALGHMVHVSENAIGNYEAGRRNPSVELLKEMAEVLKVELLDFFEEEKKTLLQFPMDYKEFMQWLEIKQLVHGFGWFTSEKFEYEMHSDRYFVELKRDYLIWLKDGFYFVPLKSEWVDSEMNDDVIDVEGVCKVLKRDIPDLEREIRKGSLITYDETLFAEQVYISKYDYQSIETKHWRDYDTLSWAAVTHDNIIAYIHEQSCRIGSLDNLKRLMKKRKTKEICIFPDACCEDE